MRRLRFSISHALLVIALVAALLALWRAERDAVTFVRDVKPADSTLRVVSHHFGDSLVAEVAVADILDSTQWDPFDDNPPISPRRAISLAWKAASTSDDIDVSRLDFRCAELCRYKNNTWYWVVQFNESFILDGVETYAYEPDFSVVVLMDGRVAISKKPSPRGPVWIELDFIDKLQ